MQKNVFLKIKEIEETKEVQAKAEVVIKTPSKQLVPNTSGNVMVIGEGSESNRKRFHKDS